MLATKCIIYLFIYYIILSYGVKLYTQPSVAPLLFSDGSLHRCRHPSLQQRVPTIHVVFLLQVFLSPTKHRRFWGGLGQESAKKKNTLYK